VRTIARSTTASAARESSCDASPEVRSRSRCTRPASAPSVNPSGSTTQRAAPGGVSGAASAPRSTVRRTRSPDISSASASARAAPSRSTTVKAIFAALPPPKLTCPKNHIMARGVRRSQKNAARSRKVSRRSFRASKKMRLTPPPPAGPPGGGPSPRP
jgi:hypothetical protein